MYPGSSKNPICYVRPRVRGAESCSSKRDLPEKFEKLSPNQQGGQGINALRVKATKVASARVTWTYTANGVQEEASTRTWSAVQKT